MVAEVVPIWFAYCDDCDWESEVFDLRDQADSWANQHNDDNHKDTE